MYSDGERGGEKHVAEDMDREIPLTQEPEESSPAPAQHELHPPPAEGGSTADAASGASTALSDAPATEGLSDLVPLRGSMRFEFTMDKTLDYFSTEQQRDRVAAILRQRGTAASPAPRNTRLQHAPQRAPQHAPQRAAVTQDTPSHTSTANR